MNTPFDRFGRAVHQWGKKKMVTPLEKAAGKIASRKRSSRAMRYQQERFHMEDPVSREKVVEPNEYLRRSSILDSRFSGLSRLDFEALSNLSITLLKEPNTESSPRRQRQVTFSDQVDFADYPSMKRRWSQTTCVSPFVQQNVQEEEVKSDVGGPAAIPAMKVWCIDDSAQFVQLSEDSSLRL
eukprot:CAMPEP_0119013252 /NCGR_PEP_ID=MMETSP1176-20130426/8244_1 /TAXON_ID=265551 /ORGANISM="Synedropsis recta cf, Strain CCMP1620" /LENGTH=182 /DNA_ID=CAMNT_0006966331 /DNA_START=41 /DNA_END=589 /DNA_ORIENTATION=-